MNADPHRGNARTKCRGPSLSFSDHHLELLDAETAEALCGNPNMRRVRNTPTSRERVAGAAEVGRVDVQIPEQRIFRAVRTVTRKGKRPCPKT